MHVLHLRTRPSITPHSIELAVEHSLIVVVLGESQELLQIMHDLAGGDRGLGEHPCHPISVLIYTTFSTSHMVLYNFRRGVMAGGLGREIRQGECCKRPHTKNQWQV
jgi:hypothetical protein